MDFSRNLPEPFLIATVHLLYSNHSGGVKDPQPETKAKDTKKNPRPRLRTALLRTDPLEAKDRNAPGQKPKTQAQVFSKEKKTKDLQQIFQAIPKKKGLKKFFFRRSPIEENKKRLLKFSARFQAFSNKISTVPKIVLSSSCLRGLEVSRPRT